MNPKLAHGPLALEGAVVTKISKHHFFQCMKNSFHGVPQTGQRTTPIFFFQNFFFTKYGR